MDERRSADIRVSLIAKRARAALASGKDRDSGLHIDTCLICGREIPPGPDVCSPECEDKLRQESEIEKLTPTPEQGKEGEAE